MTTLISQCRKHARNPQGLASIFNSGKSSSAMPASSLPLVSLLIYSSFPPPTTETHQCFPPGGGLALTKSDTLQESGTQVNLWPALHLQMGMNVDRGVWQGIARGGLSRLQQVTTFFFSIPFFFFF